MSLNDSQPVLKATTLTKRYGKARGIEDVSFEIRTGEVFGFLGPNGAGKTTTMRILMDAIRPTSGRAEVFGLGARDGKRDIHRRVGYLPSNLGLAERILVRDRLRYHANLRGGVDWSRVEMLAQHLELDVTRQMKHLSRGNQQKVGIVQAFMSDPELLLLDEPTTGLDPLMQQAFNRLVEDAKRRGRTTFLSSHILPEVEALCDRVAIIRTGRVIAVEQVATLKSRAKRRIEMRLTGDADVRWLEAVRGVTEAVANRSTLGFVAQGPIGVALDAVRGHTEIIDVITHEATLEDIFLAYYGGTS
ncbi:MAG: ABC transporter ATP-binding protein [Acidobacteriota bacterium]